MVKCSVLLYILKKSPIYPVKDEESNKIQYNNNINF